MRHLDARSNVSTSRLCMAWASNRMKNSEASTGHPVKEKLATDIDLEAKEECNLLSAISLVQEKSE